MYCVMNVEACTCLGELDRQVSGFISVGSGAVVGSKVRVLHVEDFQHTQQTIGHHLLTHLIPVLTHV